MTFTFQMPLFFMEREEPRLHSIEGFFYHIEFISADEERVLIKHADANPWDTTWKRRIQQYGYSYGTNRRESVGEIPEWLSWLCHRLSDEGIFKATPNQVIVNEYMPGQGIAPHVDYLSNYGNTVASLSLGSPVVMDFLSEEKHKISHLLEPRSLFVLSGSARFNWKHGIAPRKTDHFLGTAITRGRRLSCTFRNTSQSASRGEENR
jgi:alkylated DNA repair dioxygenase AlkB